MMKALDPERVILEPGRFSILLFLIGQDGRASFGNVRRGVRINGGTLARHQRRLARAGLIRLDKIMSATPSERSTHLILEAKAREVLRAHARRLKEALKTS
jgi:DNA-binding MarR family transcriptional regulator